MEQDETSTPRMYFQPSLVIFADEASIAIYHQFCSSDLTHRIHKPLRHAIGLIRVIPSTTVTDQNDPPIYQCRRLNMDEDNTQTDMSLLEAVDTMLRSIDTTKAENANYVVVNSLPHIYIVGHIGNEKVRSIVTELRHARFSKADSSISYLFCCDPFEIEQGQSTNTSVFTHELSEWATQNKVHCCYLYGEVPKAIYDKEEFDHAAAHALFALLATGITTQPQFAQAVPDVVCQHGTLSTCLISVPHEAIHTSCTAQVTALLLSDWITTRSKDSGNNTNALEYGVQIELERDAKSIKDLLTETTAQQVTSSGRLHFLCFPRLMHNRIWSTILTSFCWLQLPILESTYQLEKSFLALYTQKLQDLEKLTKDLFKPFVTTPSGDQWVKNLFKRFITNTPSDQWVEEMQKRYMDSCKEEPGSIRTKWQETLVDIKDQIQKKIQAHLKLTIDGMWCDSSRGPAWVIAYCDALISELDTLESRLNDLRKNALQTRKGQYLAWVKQAGIDVDEQFFSEESHQKVLCDRAKEQYKTVPSGYILWCISLISLAICIPLSTLFARLIGQPPLFLLAVIAVVIGIVFRIYLDRRYLSGLYKAQNVLIQYYQYVLIRNCVEFEYNLRISLLQSSRIFIECLSSKFIKNTQMEVEQNAKDVFQQLFKNAIARGSFFVGQDIHLSSIEVATQAFLTDNDSTATRAYRHIDTIDNHIVVKDTLWQLFQKEDSCEGKRAFLIETLRERIRKTIFIGSSDFSMRVKEQDLWQKVCKHFERRRHCQLQKDMDPSVLFLCANNLLLEEAKIQLEKVDAGKYRNRIVDMNIADVTEAQDEASDSPNWMLIVALYRQSINPAKSLLVVS